MSERRTLTIGVAINLGNYDSLRLEVSDEVADEQEAAGLAAYLNRVLDGCGKNDATARASIDKYRTRVLEKYAGEKPAAAPAADSLDELFGPVPVFDEPPKHKGEPKPEMPETPASLSPKPAEEAVQYTCEKCGADVSKVQRDVSNLFMGKTLYKYCMK